MSLVRKLLWVKADEPQPWEERKRVVTSALESGAEAVVVPREEVSKARELGAISLASDHPSPEADVELLRCKTVEESRHALGVAKELRSKGRRVAVMVEIESKELERAAVELGRASDFLIAIGKDWKVIPLENLIAELHQTGVKILAGVKDAEEARTAIETLELGADGVLLDPSSRGIGEIKRTSETLERLGVEKIELVPAKVMEIRPVGMGERACVDTATLMAPGEGMLIGSQASGLFLVHSESLPSEYTEPRPFRVNAGAIHAYVLAPGGKTKYLSELKGGDEVMIVSAGGEARPGVVGRIKIERRPLLLVEVEREGERFRALLQNAETINLVTKEGKPISVAKLKPGDEVLIHIERVGRHFGVKVAETLIER